MGEKNRIVVGRQYPDEGYAVLRCGDTEVQIGYTLLHYVQLEIPAMSYQFAGLSELQSALRQVTIEASTGRTGDE